jgi:hypothetical protein
MNRLRFKTAGKLTIVVRGIRRIYPTLIEKTGGCPQHVTGWTWQTLGSQPMIMAKNLSGVRLQFHSVGSGLTLPPSHASFTTWSFCPHMRGNSSSLGTNVTIPGHLSHLAPLTCEGTLPPCWDLGSHVN